MASLVAIFLNPMSFVLLSKDKKMDNPNAENEIQKSSGEAV